MPLNAVKRCDKNGTISEIKLPDMLLAAALTLGMFAVVKPPTKNECKPSAQSSRVQKIVTNRPRRKFSARACGNGAEFLRAGRGKIFLNQYF